MKCHKCGKVLVERHGRLEVNDKYIGPYSVDNVVYSECIDCKDRIFPLKTLISLERERERCTDKLVRDYSFDSFVTAREAADFLGISRQALHKHRRIRRGFIYQTKFGGKPVYLRQSVLLFKLTGDGRFPLLKSTVSSKTNISWATFKDTLSKVPVRYTPMFQGGVTRRWPSTIVSQIQSRKDPYYAT